ncbi:hypothetical protein GCM10023228_37830 [Brevibacillus fulvus]|uniref:YugN-like family protein n=1 Tax=Brevibacillus fulvus TaxID=1125967 RepID=A0A938Y198_9BACL|nr:hypothetical protein [Brevibacillus fulvus]
MQTIESRLNGVEGTLGVILETLAPEGFTLANWDYTKGYLDCKLDEKGMVFLRLPIKVEEGMLDNEDALIKLGTPFVLKHVYRDGLETEIGYDIGAPVAALVNQFQQPADKDAPVEQKWIDKAQELLCKVEQMLA